MELVVIILVLFIDRVALNGNLDRQMVRLQHYFAWAQQTLSLSVKGTNGYLYVLPLILLVGLTQWSLDGVLDNIPTLIFTVIVLLYSLGPENVTVDTENLPNESSNQQTTHKILVASSQAYIAPIFWFLILGPIGAVTYRLCQQWEKYRDNIQDPDTTTSLLYWLNWIPTRLTLFAYALVGNFGPVMQRWLHAEDSDNNLNKDQQMLIDCGMLVIEQSLTSANDQSQQAFNLMWRSINLWIGALALWYLGSWL